jgi:hypothetical protein
VVPIEDSLLYVEPIYLKSDTESNFPEMKMVVVSFGEKIVMEPTLDEAIERLFGIIENQKPEEDREYDDTNINDLIEQANKAFNDANQASQSGDWSAYGNNLEKLEKLLKQLNMMVNNSAGTQENNSTDGTVDINQPSDDSQTQENQNQQ